ncbi:MAG: MFS transporter [Promethearchaeota archaeon]
MNKTNVEYKSLYTGVFSLNYFVQGINQSIFTTVVPIYILNLLGVVDTVAIASMGSIIMIPFVLKLIFGLISDKVEIGKLGRRKPWIIGATNFAGIMWLILPPILFSNPWAAYSIFTLVGFFVMFGTAFSDTSMDGFIMDICPKNLLGRVTGAVWGFRSMGIITGGLVILLLINIIPVETIFIFLGIITIIFGWLILLIKHGETTKDREILSNLKIIFKRKENWKVFFFSMFMAVVDGVIFLFIALYILIRAGLVNPVGATIEILDEDLNLYYPQAFITLIVSLGVLAGAFIGGRVADKVSRRVATFSSFILTTSALLLLLIPVPSNLVFILLIFTFIAGSSSGWSNSAFSSISGEYAQQYPEAPGTYLSLCTSFINFGTLMGLSFTAQIFSTASTLFTDVLAIYATVFIFMAFLSNIAIIPFLTLDKHQYEYKLREESSMKEMLKP